jgi:hypothetical protein
VSKQAMREAMPVVAEIVDTYRQWMEPGGKVIYASENGRVIDRRTPEREVFTVPPGYRMPTKAMKEKTQ